MIDDSALFHGTYDPVKAREYYLRTRKLKGRRPAASKQLSATTRSPAKKSASIVRGGAPNRANTKSRRAELEAQKEALEKRLDRLREVLREKVEAAKKRSGGQKKEAEKKSAPETEVDKADRNKAEKKSKPEKPETAAEKKERAKAAKEAYEKEHPNTLSQDVDILKAQIEDIQNKIQKAVADARDRKPKAGDSSIVRSNPKNPDGPRGR